MLVPGTRLGMKARINFVRAGSLDGEGGLRLLGPRTAPLTGGGPSRISSPEPATDWRKLAAEVV